MVLKFQRNRLRTRRTHLRCGVGSDVAMIGYCGGCRGSSSMRYFRPCASRMEMSTFRTKAGTEEDDFALRLSVAVSVSPNVVE